MGGGGGGAGGGWRGRTADGGRRARSGKSKNPTQRCGEQSKYELPFRSIVVASLTGGKTVLIQNLILNVYRDCFARIFIFSPSVHNDPTFVEVKKYQKDNTKVDDEKEKLYYDTNQPEELEEIINTQRKIIHYMKEQKMKKLHSYSLLMILQTTLNLLDTASYYTDWQREVGTMPLVFV